jgi:hypothetical protein
VPFATINEALQRVLTGTPNVEELCPAACKITYSELLTNSIVFKLEAWRKLPAEYQVFNHPSNFPMLLLTLSLHSPGHCSSISHLFERKKKGQLIHLNTIVVK